MHLHTCIIVFNAHIDIEGRCYCPLFYKGLNSSSGTTWSAHKRTEKVARCCRTAIYDTQTTQATGIRTSPYFSRAGGREGNMVNIVTEAITTIVIITIAI